MKCTMTMVMVLLASICSAAPGEPVVNVLELGAHNDGTHPQETRNAMATAVRKAAQMGSGAMVLLPPGKYLLNQTVPVTDATISGPGATVVVKSKDAYVFGFALGANGSLERLRIEGEGGFSVPVDVRSGARNVRLRNVRITGGRILFNIHAPDVENVEVTGCEFFGGGYGVLLNSKCSGRNVRITNNYFKDNGADSIELNFPKEEKGNFTEGIVIANNIFENTGRGNPNNPNAGFAIGMAGARRVQITGNTFRKAAVQGVHIEDNSRDVTVAGNTFVDCGLGCTTGNWTGGVHILSGSQNIAVTGNTFTRCRFGVTGLQRSALRYLTVNGNTFRQCEKGCWFMEFPYGTVVGNVFIDCQMGIEIWRTPGWTVANNLIRSSRPGAVGVRSYGYRDFVMIGNTIQCPVPLHNPEPQSDTEKLITDNLIRVVEPPTQKTKEQSEEKK